MQAESQRTLSTDNCRVEPRICPSCRCALVRERRRIVDRLYSLIKPVKRYRCQNFACQWVGNFAITKAMHDMDPPPHRVPVAFVVYMGLVAVGVVAVIVLSNTEPTIWTSDGETQVGSSSDYELPAERTVTTAGITLIRHGPSVASRTEQMLADRFIFNAKPWADPVR